MTWADLGTWTLLLALLAAAAVGAIGILLDSRRDRARWRAEDAARRSLHHTHLEDEDDDQRTT